MVRVHHASFRTPTGSSSSRCWRRAISTTCGASGLYGRSSGPTVSCCRRRRCRGSSGTAPAGQSATTTRSGCPDGGTRAGFPLGVCCYHRSVVIVLGISETHCATAAVLRDGAIVGCASEERFSRLKNDAGYPRVAIDALLRELALSPAAVARVVLAGTRIPSYDWMNRVMRDPAYAREYYAVRLDAPRRRLTGRARRLGAKLGLLDPAPGKSPLPERERRVAVTTHLGIDADRVSLVDHHTCHAAAAYFGSPFAGASALVLTNDNSGDGLCATASSGRGITLERSEATPSGPGSLGSFYTLVTLLLGMKPGEHEYKVMGLAPYASAEQTERAAAALRTVFDFADGRPCRFEWRKRGPLYRAVLEATLGLRFDGIAGGVTSPAATASANPRGWRSGSRSCSRRTASWRAAPGPWSSARERSATARSSGTRRTTAWSP